MSSGQELWYAQNDTVTGVSGAVVYRNVDGVFRSVDQRTGAENWSTDLGWSGDFAVDTAGERIYVLHGLDGFRPPTKFRGVKADSKGRPGITAIDMTDGSEMWHHDMRDPLIFDDRTFDGEILLVFEDRLVWIDLSIAQVNNSILLEVPADGGQTIYLYVIDEPSRQLRYYQSIATYDGYLRYDNLGLYLLSMNAKGRTGTLGSVSLSAYVIP